MDIITSIIENAKRTGKVSFGGEYSFLLTDDLDTALKKLYKTSCDIGGSVILENMYLIKVYPCYDDGYYSLYWLDEKRGISRISYWTKQERYFSR